MKKILLILMLICPLFVQGCSCDKFDINTYTSAVKRYNDSTGVEYKLTITTKTAGENEYKLEESTNKYIFSTTKEVLNYSSILREYKIITNEYGTNSAPLPVSTLERYYKRENTTFYTNDVTRNEKTAETITYEEKYDEDNKYNIYNLVPVFDRRNIDNFSIVKDSKGKGNSIATFDAACPATSSCTEDVTKYTVYMNKYYNFTKIEFTTINGDVTTTYKYEFYKYNSDVQIEFPSDLASY